MDHALKTLLGCLVAFGLLFLLPLLGFGEGVTLFAFIVAMFLCHLLLAVWHGHAHDDDDE